MRCVKGLVLAGVATVLVLPATAGARWDKQCETITRTSGSPVFRGPTTWTTCRDVWIPDIDRNQDIARQIDLVSALVRVCEELNMELEPCIEYLPRLSAGAASQK